MTHRDPDETELDAMEVAAKAWERWDVAHPVQPTPEQLLCDGEPRHPPITVIGHINGEPVELVRAKDWDTCEANRAGLLHSNTELTAGLDQCLQDKERLDGDAKRHAKHLGCGAMLFTLSLCILCLVWAWISGRS